MCVCVCDVYATFVNILYWIIIRYNISQLEDWVKGANLTKSGAIEALQPVIQATKLLQMRKKTDKDAISIIEACPKLNTLQVGE